MKRVFPILAVLTGVLLSYALYEALIAAPTEQTMGPVQRIFYYHVPSAWTAFILFFINFFASIVYLDLARKQSRYCCSGHGRSWSCLLHRRAGDGADLGASGVGNMVDLGYAPHPHACAVADLRELSGAATVFQQRPDALVGGGFSRLWRARRSPGLFFHLVFPHAASAAGDWRRRFHRSPHAACAADQLAGLLLLCRAGMLVSLSPGSDAQRHGRDPGP